MSCKLEWPQGDAKAHSHFTSHTHDLLFQMHNKSLLRHYTAYINNFAKAMHVLERSIHKKQKFVDFLKSKYASSKTSLSLQGLLLKPIQRFPQYILFLTVSLQCHHFCKGVGQVQHVMHEVKMSLPIKVSFQCNRPSPKPCTSTPDYQTSIATSGFC